MKSATKVSRKRIPIPEILAFVAASRTREATRREIAIAIGAPTTTC